MLGRWSNSISLYSIRIL